MLILPPLTNLEGAAWEQIKAFVESGGTVISIGSLPYENIDRELHAELEVSEWFGVNDSEALAYWSEDGDGWHGKGPFVKGRLQSYFIPESGKKGIKGACAAMLDLLRQAESALVSISSDVRSDCFLMYQRKLDDVVSLIFITNQEGDYHHVEVKLPKARSQAVHYRLLDLETGQSKSLQPEMYTAHDRLSLEFAPYQSYLIECNITADNLSEQQSGDPAWEWEIPSDGPWSISLEQYNVMRIETFDLTMAGDQTAYSIRPKTFIDQCSDLAENQRYSLSFRQLFGTPMNIQLSYPIDCKYQSEFHVHDLPSSCLLMKERGAVAGDYKIYINDQLVKPEDWETRFIYDQHNEIQDIHSMLRKGKNTLMVEVCINNDWDGLLEPIYLLGDFSVFRQEESQDLVMEQRIPSGKLDQLSEAGLPYYAGTVWYTKNIELETLPDSKMFQLHVAEGDTWFHDAIEVRVNGHSLGIRPWTPYRWQGNKEVLQPGDNHIEVGITNTLIGMLEGKRFNYEIHALEDAIHPIPGPGAGGGE